MVDEEWATYLKLQTPDRTFAFAGAKPVEQPLPGLQRRHTVATIITQPFCEALNISTKTKALFLDQAVDLHHIFWEIPVVSYGLPVCGVVKKQMKIVSNSPEEVEAYLQKLEGLPFYREHIIRQINTVNVRRVKFKDERKLSVGISQKDILNARGKVKNAFYNCFALILRIHLDGQFREIHVKLFNTGKMEIPGVLNAAVLETVKAELLRLLSPHMPTVTFLENQECDGVLINSNFNCGFDIDRDTLYHILRSDKYRLEAAYDSCSYPGIKCKFYFNHETGFDVVKQRGTIDGGDCGLKLSALGKTSKYTEVSIMIFRTGSCLIVGNCSEPILVFIYEFVKRLLSAEYVAISTTTGAGGEERETKGPKKIKARKKTVDMTLAYRQELAIARPE